MTFFWHAYWILLHRHRLVRKSVPLSWNLLSLHRNTLPRNLNRSIYLIPLIIRGIFNKRNWNLPFPSPLFVQGWPSVASSCTCEASLVLDMQWNVSLVSGHAQSVCRTAVKPQHIFFIYATAASLRDSNAHLTWGRGKNNMKHNFLHKWFVRWFTLMKNVQ